MKNILLILSVVLFIICLILFNGYIKLQKDFNELSNLMWEYDTVTDSLIVVLARIGIQMADIISNFSTYTDCITNGDYTVAYNILMNMAERIKEYQYIVNDVLPIRLNQYQKVKTKVQSKNTRKIEKSENTEDIEEFNIDLFKK